MADTVSVTQADREAAASFIEAYWNCDASMLKLAASYRAGHTGGIFARAFARHRLASTQPAPAFPREEATDAMVLAGARVWLGEGLQKVPADWVERMRLTWCAMRAALLQGKQP